MTNTTTGERTYKGMTYWVHPTKEGWMYILQTSTGTVEDGYYANQFSAEVAAHETIQLIIKN